MQKLIAAIFVLVFLVLMGLYVREFPVFDNTIGVRTLVFGSLAVGLVLSIVLFILLKKRLSPLENHLPETVSIFVICLVFAPLFGSLFNRLGASEKAERSFFFEKETAFRISRFGCLAGLQNESPAGWHLFVNDGRKRFRFRYQKQPYFPITKPGELVLLPVKTGLFGFPIVDLK